MFVHLHWHSTFSFLEAIGKPWKIASRAKELGMPAVAITDYNGIYGTIKFLQACKDEWIKPIIWAELGFVLDFASKNVVENIGNIVILAQNNDGYQNLMELISFAGKEWIVGKPKIDVSVLSRLWSGIIAFFWWKESWIWKMILNDEKEEKIKEIINMIQNAVGKENTYLEIIAQQESLDNDLQKVNHAILSLSKELNVPCVVNTNYHYIKKDDRAAWEIALDIKDGKRSFDEWRRQVKGEFYIMTEEEILDVCKKNWYDESLIQSWIANNLAISEHIETKIKLNQILFPNYESPEDIQELYQKYWDQLIEKND